MLCSYVAGVFVDTCMGTSYQVCAVVVDSWPGFAHMYEYIDVV